MRPFQIAGVSVYFIYLFIFALTKSSPGIAQHGWFLLASPALLGDHVAEGPSLG